MLNFSGQSSNTVGFENGADLGLKTVGYLDYNGNLPLCQSKNIDHSKKLIIFFTHDQETKLNFPESINKLIKMGCKIAIITFNWQHLRWSANSSGIL